MRDIVMRRNSNWEESLLDKKLSRLYKLHNSHQRDESLLFTRECSDLFAGLDQYTNSLVSLSDDDFSRAKYSLINTFGTYNNEMLFGPSEKMSVFGILRQDRNRVYEFLENVELSRQIKSIQNDLGEPQFKKAETPEIPKGMFSRFVHSAAQQVGLAEKNIRDKVSDYKSQIEVLAKQPQSKNRDQQIQKIVTSLTNDLDKSKSEIVSYFSISANSGRDVNQRSFFQNLDIILEKAGKALGQDHSIDLTTKVTEITQNIANNRALLERPKATANSLRESLRNDPYSVLGGINNINEPQNTLLIDLVNDKAFGSGALLRDMQDSVNEALYYQPRDSSLTDKQLGEWMPVCAEVFAKVKVLTEHVKAHGSPITNLDELECYKKKQHDKDTAPDKQASEAVVRSSEKPVVVRDDSEQTSSQNQGQNGSFVEKEAARQANRATADIVR